MFRFLHSFEFNGWRRTCDSFRHLPWLVAYQLAARLRVCLLYNKNTISIYSGGRFCDNYLVNCLRQLWIVTFRDNAIFRQIWFLQLALNGERWMCGIHCIKTFNSFNEFSQIRYLVTMSRNNMTHRLLKRYPVCLTCLKISFHTCENEWINGKFPRKRHNLQVEFILLVAKYR